MKTLLAAALLALSAPAFALTPDELARQLNNAPYLEADFIQDKQVAGLSRPLTSRGHMALARQGGVLWQIDAPYAIRYFLSEQRLIEISEGRREEKDAASLPWLARIAEVMHALLAADLAALRASFSLELKGSAEAWSLVLIPKDERLAEVLNRIEIQGGQNLERLALDEVSGDTTRIRFSASKPQASVPAALAEFLKP